MQNWMVITFLYDFKNLGYFLYMFQKQFRYSIFWLMYGLKSDWSQMFRKDSPTIKGRQTLRNPVVPVVAILAISKMCS